MDDPNGGVIADEVNVACEPQQETFFLNVQPDEGGYVTSGGDVWVGGDPKSEEIVVGDNFSEGIMSFLQVTLATLPDDLVTIESATLSFTVNELVNLPVGAFLRFTIYQVDYGDALTEDDYLAFGLPGGLAYLENQDVSTGIKTSTSRGWSKTPGRTEELEGSVSNSESE